MTRVRSLARQVLHLDEPPQRTALAFAVGIFIAFSPTYGLHTLSVFFCTWAFRLNFVALLAGSLINNPWTVVPILGATFWTGFLIMGIPDVPPFEWHNLTLESVYLQVRPYALPFVIGAVTLSLLGAVIGYPLAYYVISQFRVRRPASPGEERLRRESR